MFCKWCGAEVKNTDIYCPKCGGKLNNPSTTDENNVLPVVRTDKKTRRKAIIAAGVLILTAVIAAVFLLGGRSYRETVDQFFEATFTADVNAIVKLIPDAVIENAMEENGYDRDEMSEFLQEGADTLQEQINRLASYLGEDWEVSHDILGAEDITGEEFEEIKTAYDDMDAEVSSAKSVDVKMTVKSGETENSVQLNIPVIKVGRSWYLDIMNLEDIC